MCCTTISHKSVINELILELYRLDKCVETGLSGALEEDLFGFNSVGWLCSETDSATLKRENTL